MAALVIGTRANPTEVANAHLQVTGHRGFMVGLQDYQCKTCLLTIVGGVVVRGERGVRG